MECWSVACPVKCGTKWSLFLQGSYDKKNKNLCESYIHILSRTLVVVKNYPGTNFRKVILREISGE